MCGVIAIFSQHNTAQSLYQGLLHLQHRGQDAAGMATLDEEGLHLKRSLGRVDEIFSQHSLSELTGSLGIGHTRYATSGDTQKYDAQPFERNHSFAIALAHSGHLHPASWMDTVNKKSLSSRVDSNLLLHFFGSLLDNCPLTTNDEHFFSFLCHTITTIFHQVKGSYSIVSLITGKGLLIIRDPSGIRPLTMAERTNTAGSKDYLVASESYFFNELGFKQIKDIEPGEILYINSKGKLYRQTLVQGLKTPCSFEYVYFAQPKSIMNGVLVEESRRRMGKLLALRWQNLHPELKPNFVLPIPNTANTAAFAFAQHLGFSYKNYLQVNKSSGRTFIQDTDSQRQHAVSKKLTIDPDKTINKKIVLFDDSLIRGTTVIPLIKKLRLLGVEAIYLVISCPPITNVCTYGINISTCNELIASGRSLSEIKSFLQVDELLYATTEDLINSIYPNSTGQSTVCIQCMTTTGSKCK